MTYTKNNIAVLTGSRAEYSLMRPILKIIKKNKSKHRLNIIVTSTHLSEEYGYTKNEILQDNLKFCDQVMYAVAWAQDYYKGLLDNQKIYSV